MYVFFESLSLEKVKISKNSNEDHERNLAEIIEDGFVLVDEEDTQEVHAHSPDDRSDKIVWPEVFLLHPARSCDERHKRACKIMELAENDIPETIFCDLLRENVLFCLPESDVVAVLGDDLVPIPLTDPVAEIVPEHSTNSGE